MKNKRQDIILEIIKDNKVETQEALQEMLAQRGFNVTQATVSRDIKELRLIKRSGRGGSYHYEMPGDMQSDRNIFFDVVTKVDYAVNTVVIKCRNGMAQTACAALDGMEYNKIVGTLAGDDTIFVLMRTENDAADLVKTLGKLIRG